MDPQSPPQSNTVTTMTLTFRGGLSRSEIRETLAHNLNPVLADEERLEAKGVALQITNIPQYRLRKEIMLWLAMGCIEEIGPVETPVTAGGLDTFTDFVIPPVSIAGDAKAWNRASTNGNRPCYAVSPYKVPAWLTTPPSPSGISETDWILKMIKEESKVSGWTLYAIALHARKLEDDVDRPEMQEQFRVLLHPFRVEQLKPVIELIEAQKPEVKRFLKRMPLPESMATLEAWIKTK